MNTESKIREILKKIMKSGNSKDAAESLKTLEKSDFPLLYRELERKKEAIRNRHGKMALDIIDTAQAAIIFGHSSENMGDYYDNEIRSIRNSEREKINALDRIKSMAESAEKENFG